MEFGPNPEELGLVRPETELIKELLRARLVPPERSAPIPPLKDFESLQHLCIFRRQIAELRRPQALDVFISVQTSNLWTSMHWSFSSFLRVVVFRKDMTLNLWLRVFAAA